MKKLILFLLFTICITGYAQELNGNEILEIVDNKLAPRNNEMYRKIINTEASGKTKEFVMYSAKKGDDKIFSAFIAPASEKGRTTLRVGDNMWSYIPAVKRPIRITSMQSVIGGLFNNSDIMRVDFVVEYNATILESNDSEYLIELKAKTKEVAYDKIKMWITKGNMLPYKYEAYTYSGMLYKVIELTNVTDFGNGIIRPAKITTTSPLQKGAKSEMIYLKVNPKEFPDEMFTLANMSKVNIK
jgi:outer membrane lipoprotein-sorting protein